MANIKPGIWHDFKKPDGKSNIKIRVSHNHKVRYISTPYDIDLKYMKDDGTVKSSYRGYTTLNNALSTIESGYNAIIAGINTEDLENMDIKVLCDRLKRKTNNKDADFIAYANDRIISLRKAGRISYAVTIEATLKHLKDCFGLENLLFKEITVISLNKFKNYLQDKGKRINTIRIYLNNIRTIFNNAIDDDIIKQEIFPFSRKFKIEQEATSKRDLDAADIRLLLKQKLSPARQRALDIFMLSFYLIGMNLKDMLFLNHDAIHKGRIDYTRFKTKHKYSIKILPPAMHLIEKYKGSKYLLRFMEVRNLQRKTEPYKDIVKDTNKLLKKIAKDAKINVPLSTYYARHSWATIASDCNISKDVISAALGHELGSKTTAIYINYDLKKVDAANQKVIHKIL